MGLTIRLDRTSGTSVRVDQGSRRAPDKNCTTVTVLQSEGGSMVFELNRAEAEALADALKKAVAR
jgi:hypothetical protein